MYTLQTDRLSTSTRPPPTFTRPGPSPLTTKLPHVLVLFESTKISQGCMGFAALHWGRVDSTEGTKLKTMVLQNLLIANSLEVKGEAPGAPILLPDWLLVELDLCESSSRNCGCCEPMTTILVFSLRSGVSRPFTLSSCAHAIPVFFFLQCSPSLREAVA